MIGYAIFHTGGMSAVTRDYVEYLTANRILLGAEFDKIITIVLVTAILAIAIMRARRTLVRGAEEHAAAVALSRFFSPESPTGSPTRRRGSTRARASSAMPPS